MRINRRLVLLVSVPLAVAVAISVRALAPATSHAIEAQRLTAMSEAAAAAGDLSFQLQRERAAATALVASQMDSAAFRKRADATDASIERYQEERDELSSVPDNAQAALDRVDGSLEELPSLRAQVRSGASTLSALAFSYRITIADLIDYRDGVAQANGVDADVADRIRAAAALSQAIEHIGQQQVTVMRAQAGGGFTPASQQTFDASRLGYTESTGVLFALGPEEWRTWLERTLSGPEALTAQRLEDEVGRSAVGQELELSTREWQGATSDRLELLRSVERRIDDSIHGTVTAERSSLAWWAIGEVSAVLLTLVGAVVVATRLSRVMLRRLRDLQKAALEVANERLPRVMTHLSQPGALGGATPTQVAQNSGKPVRTTGEDEIGEVGEAFNSVHYEAVRLAAQQADSHERFAETLVGVARRGAQLTGVMVSELDAVQRDEADPERMKVLFALDHLAIRMERNTNNLLVLGGHGHARVRSADASATSVIYAAAQQVERFGRVSLGIVEPGIGIAARVVHDLAHILAELLDNATRFSPPDKQVGVAVWRLWDRAVVQVVDEGVGISPERRAEFNARLLEPRTDVGAVRSMGLHVAARLATRHGIVVELRSSAGPGTIAEVTLPSSVLVEAPEDALPEEPEAFQERRPGPGQDAARARNPLGGPDSRLRPLAGDDATESPNGSGHDRSENGDRPPGGPRQPEYDMADRIAGVSSSGLPLRARQSSDQWPRFPGQKGTREPAASGAKTRPAPRRRDSRQISDVLAAYTQGISKSTSRREDSATTDSTRSANDDDTQRSK